MWIVLAMMLSLLDARAVSVAERTKGAEVVMVASVGAIRSAFATNSFGDQVIVSRASIQAREVLKGKAELTEIEFEGGTVGDVTLTVSDMPELRAGDRAIFFLRRGKSGAYDLHLRGLGAMPLDAKDRVKGGGQSLAEVRRQVKGAQ